MEDQLADLENKLRYRSNNKKYWTLAILMLVIELPLQWYLIFRTDTGSLLVPLTIIPNYIIAPMLRKRYPCKPEDETKNPDQRARILE